MDNLNLSQKDYFMLSCLLLVALVMYMEVRKNRCKCTEGWINTEFVKPTFYRSLTSLPNVDGPFDEPQAAILGKQSQ